MLIPETIENLMLKYLSRNYPIFRIKPSSRFNKNVRVKYNTKFKRAIKIKGKIYFLDSEFHINEVRQQLVCVLKKVFNYDDLICLSVLTYF